MAFALPVWKENQELLGTFTKMWSFKVWEQTMQRSLENTALSVHDSLTGDQYTNTGSRWFQAWHQLPYSHYLTMVNFAFHQLLRREPFPMKFQSELLALVRFHSFTFRFFFNIDLVLNTDLCFCQASSARIYDLCVILRYLILLLSSFLPALLFWLFSTASYIHLLIPFCPRILL